MYREPQASETLLNFKNGVAPKSQKISTLIGEIYRCQNTTTTPEALELALNTTKKIFVKNQYPEKLINQKIRELKLKNFPPAQSKARRTEELKNPNIINHTLRIPLTSFRSFEELGKLKKFSANTQKSLNVISHFHSLTPVAGLATAGLIL